MTATERPSRRAARHRVLTPLAGVVAAGATALVVALSAGPGVAPLAPLAVVAGGAARTQAAPQAALNAPSHRTAAKDGETAGKVDELGTDEQAENSADRRSYGDAATAASSTGRPTVTAFSPAELVGQLAVTPTLARAAPASASLRLTADAHGRRLLATLASLLGLHGRPVAARGGFWLTPAVHAAALRLIAGVPGALVLEGSTARACHPSGATAFDVDGASLTRALGRLLGPLGLPYELTEPRLAVAWRPDGRGRCRGETLLTAQVAVRGLATDLLATAGFDADGRLLALRLPVFGVAATAAYPLVSPARAAAALAAASPAPTKAVRDAATRGGVTALSTSGTLALPVVELRSATVSLGTFTTPSGSTWLLPVYTLAGERYGRATGAPAAWTGVVLAVARPGVTLLGASSNQAVLLDLGGQGAR